MDSNNTLHFFFLIFNHSKLHLSLAVHLADTKSYKKKKQKKKPLLTKNIGEFSVIKSRECTIIKRQEKKKEKKDRINNRTKLEQEKIGKGVPRTTLRFHH